MKAGLFALFFVQASAVGPVAIEAHRLQVHEIRLAAMEGIGWRFDLTVSGAGEVLLAVETATVGALRDLDLNELAWQTGPRFVEVGPFHPCAEESPLFGKVFAPTLDYSWPQGPLEYKSSWPRERPNRLAIKQDTFRSDKETKAFLRNKGWGQLQLPVRVVRFTVTSSLGQVSLSSRNDPLFKLTTAELQPPQRTQRVDLYSVTSGGSTPRRIRGASSLPEGFSIPEVAFEYPFDTEQAIVRHTQRKSGAKPVLIYSGEVRLANTQYRSNRYRFETLFARKLPQWSETLEPMERFSAKFFVHRPFRTQLSCNSPQILARYWSRVAQQQVLHHQLLNAATGRPREALYSLSEERRYLVHPNAMNPLLPVRVDRKRWRLQP